jgi:hypothetical protein
VRRDQLQDRLPASHSEGKVIANGELAVRWKLNDGAQLSLLANFTANPVALAAPPSGLLLATTDVLLDSTPATLPPWFVGWYLEDF